jgi:cold shock CspA family protein
VSVLDVDRSTAIPFDPSGRNMPLVAPKRVEIGKLVRKTRSGSAFMIPEFGGVNIFIPVSVAAGLDVGARIECDIGDGDKGPVAVKLRKVL